MTQPNTLRVLLLALSARRRALWTALRPYVIRSDTDAARLEVFLALRDERYVAVEAHSRQGTSGLERWGVALVAPDAPPRRPEAAGLPPDRLVERAYPLIDGIADQSEPLPFVLLQGSSITQTVTLDALALRLCAQRSTGAVQLIGYCVTTRGKVLLSAPVRVAPATLDSVCDDTRQ